MQGVFWGFQEACLLFCIIIIMVLTLQKACEEQKYLMLATGAAMVANLGCLLLLLDDGQEIAVFSSKIHWIGNMFCVFFILLFAVSYLRIKISRKTYGILLAVLIGEMYLKKMGTVMMGKELVVQYEMGWGYYLVMCLSLIFVGRCVAGIVKRTIRMTHEECRRFIWLFCGTAVSVLVFCAYMSEIFRQYKFWPVVVVALCLFFTIMLLRSEITQMQYFTHSELLQKMEQGIILVDAYYNLLEYNSVAADIFPELSELERGDKVSDSQVLMQLLKRNANHNFQIGDFYYEAQITSIMDKAEIKGYSVWIYDVTEMRAYTDELIRLKEQADYSNKEKSNFLANMSHEIRTPMNVIIGSTELILREHASDTVLENASTIKQAGQNLLGIINDILDFSKIEAGKMAIVPVDYSLDAMILDLVNMTIVRMADKELDFYVDVDVTLPRFFHGDDIRIKQIIINLLTNAVKFTQIGHITLRISRLDSASEDGASAMLRIDVEDSGSGIKKDNLENLFDSFSRFDTVKNRAVEGTGLGLAISLMLAKNMGGRLLVESEYGKGSCFSLEIPQKICQKQSSIGENHYHKALVLEKDRQYVKIFDEAFRNMDIAYVIMDSEERFFDELNYSYDIVFVDKETYDSPLVTGLKIDKVVLLDKQESVKRRKEEDILIMKQILGIKLRSILNQTYSHELRANAKASIQEFVAPEAKILIVDDNAVNLKIATGLLKPFEIQIETVDSGKKAISKIEENDYDIVFMDHMMPDMDGIQTTNKIRSKVGRKYQDVVIIALTANAVNGAKNIFLSSGMQDFLSKPIEMEKMIQILKRWLPKEKFIERHADKKPDIEIKGFDYQKGLANCGGDEKQYQMSLKVYYMMAGRFMDELAGSMENKDLNSIGRIVHTLAGESGKIGAVRFEQFLNKYEKECMNGNEHFVLKNYAFLQKVYKEIEEGLKEHIK